MLRFCQPVSLLNCCDLYLQHFMRAQFTCIQCQEIFVILSMNELQEKEQEFVIVSWTGRELNTISCPKCNHTQLNQQEPGEGQDKELFQ